MGNVLTISEAISTLQNFIDYRYIDNDEKNDENHDKLYKEKNPQIANLVDNYLTDIP